MLCIIQNVLAFINKCNFDILLSTFINATIHKNSLWKDNSFRDNAF